MHESPSPLRRILLWAGLLVCLVVLGWQVSNITGNPGVLTPRDFVEYWAAGRLNLHGQNPFDPELLFPLQKEAGWDKDYAVMMFNPPWTLTLVMPFGMLDFSVGRALWLLLNLAGTLFAADRLWSYYGGPASQRWLPALLACSFYPTLMVVREEQISVVLLLGVVGFLEAERRGRWWLAGAALALVSIKPHLLHLFWIVLVLWVVSRRRWGVLCGLAGVLVAATVAALVPNPQVLHQYLANARGEVDSPLFIPAHQFLSPTIGTWLRLGENHLTGAGWNKENFWLQFVVPALSVVWLIPYWLRRQQTWEWSEKMPVLLLVSVLTTSYGAWPNDLVVLLVPVVQVATWVRQDLRWSVLALASHLLISGAAVAMYLSFVTYEWYVWMAPALLITYLALQRSAVSGQRSAIPQLADR